MIKRIPPLLLAAATLFTVTQARADDVRLKNGGRVRGKIMEYDPARGVRIQLADGTVRELTAAEVAGVTYSDAAPPPRTPSSDGGAAAPVEKGTIEIVSDENGTVYAAQPYTRGRRVRYGPMARVGKVQARQPTTLTLPGGLNRVKVDFDDGGSAGDVVTISPDSSVRLTVQGLKAWLDGPRLWIGAVLPSFWIGGPFFSFTYELQAALTIPIADPVGLRVGLRGGPGFGLGDVDGLLGHVGVEGVFRFALSSVYGMEAGVDGGIFQAQGEFGGETAGYIGPRFSLMSLRVGPHRNSELAIRNSVPIYLQAGSTFAVGFNAEFSFAVMAFEP